MPVVAIPPEGCTSVKAKQGLALLASLLSFFVAQLCRMGTPTCSMGKGTHGQQRGAVGGHCREQGVQWSHGNRCQLSFPSCWWRNPYGKRTRGE